MRPESNASSVRPLLQDIHGWSSHLRQPRKAASQRAIVESTTVRETRRSLAAILSNRLQGKEGTVTREVLCIESIIGPSVIKVIQSLAAFNFVLSFTVGVVRWFQFRSYADAIHCSQGMADHALRRWREQLDYVGTVLMVVIGLLHHVVLVQIHRRGCYRN